MLFNSYIFIFLFLPLSLIGFYTIGRICHRNLAFVWLGATSLFFYGWWNHQHVIVILVSVIFNYAVGLLIIRSARKYCKVILAFGILSNVAALFYYKYANFFVDTIGGFLHEDIFVGKIVLPLAISFFTFQQIAYLVDIYQGKTKECDFLSYFTFVTFFPQLIAGPIVHHQQIIPQFDVEKISCKSSDLAVGGTIFFMGLFKKTIIADGIKPYADSIFNGAANGISPLFFQSWGGVLAFSFQIYFDFSAYSDMALGLGRMFGVKLPLNFNSPYKATSIIDFWKRWHITLSLFLKDYLYIPMGGNQAGILRRHVNLMTVMLLGGLWHGANWTFIFWGGVHGVYLSVNHIWRSFVSRRFRCDNQAVLLLANWFSGLFTFMSVALAWVLFRAENLPTAVNIYKGLLGLNGVSIHMPIALKLEMKDLFEKIGILMPLDGARHLSYTYMWVLALSVYVFILPNISSIMKNYEPVCGDSFKEEGRMCPSVVDKYLIWSPTFKWAICLSIVTVIAVLGVTRMNSFIYFNF